jgi:diguanylate cyclase (GGDEF)-like protein
MVTSYRQLWQRRCNAHFAAPIISDAAVNASVSELALFNGRYLIIISESASSPTNEDAVSISLNAVPKGFFAVAFAAAMWWLISRMLGSHYQWIKSAFLCCSIVAVIGLFIYRTSRRWARPMRQLQTLLPQVQSGDLPIEELSKIGGGMTPLMPQIRQLMHDLRRQKMLVVELHREVDQRVAGRTNALERKLGSMRQQAVQDVLTGLFNRRMFDEHLPQIVQRCAAEKIELSLLAIDVDNFKKLNDTLGHGAGDELLRNIGQIVRSGIREEDAAFRLGGDEFAVVLPGAKLAAAQKLAQRLMDLVDALAKPLHVTQPPRLSIGVASISQLPANASVREFVELADQKLYEVKAERHRTSPRLSKAS